MMNTGIGTPEEIVDAAVDFNGDGAVDFPDFLRFVGAFEGSDGPG